MSERSDPLRVEYSEAENGLRIARQSPPAGSASISATYVGPAGWGFDPEREAGVARLANQLVTSAAGSHDRVALARLLDRAGATLTRQCAPESAEVTIWGPEDEWEFSFESSPTSSSARDSIRRTSPGSVGRPSSGSSVSSPNPRRAPSGS